MKYTEDQIKEILSEKIVGKQILSIDTDGLWIDDKGELHLENVTSINIEGGIVLALQGSSNIDDCVVDVTLSNDLETLRTNVDYEYKRIWIVT